VRWILLAALLLGFGLALPAACGGCVTPPLVLPGGLKFRDVSKLPYPPASQAVDLEVEPGHWLHGVFVPADEGAPVVLHLLESSGSFTPSLYSKSAGEMTVTVTLGQRPVVWELADLGLASLIVDYSGVGPSDGERDPATLARDAQAMYAEALRRAGGREDRVVVRGTSIGALAAAALLDAGRRPAALLLVAPVRAETAAGHFARAYHGTVLAFFITPWLKSGLDVDLVATVGAARMPLIAVTTPHDELLPPEEQEILHAAVNRAGGQWAALDAAAEPVAGGRFTLNGVTAFPKGDHFPLSYAARHLLATERTLLACLFPEAPHAEARVETLVARLDPDLQARFAPGSPERESLAAAVAGRLHDDASLAALVVLAGCTRGECRRFLDSARRVGEVQVLPLETWVGNRDREAALARLDLSDPAGRVPADLVVSVASQIQSVSEPGEWDDASWDLAHALDFARGAAVPGEDGRVARRTYHKGAFKSVRGLRLDELWDDSHNKGASDTETCRLLLRAILKGAGIDERVVTAPDGSHALEVREGETWRVLDPLLMLEPRDG